MMRGYVYFAHPIDSTNEYVQRVVAHVRSEFFQSSIPYFSPEQAWRNTLNSGAVVQDVNEVAVVHARAVVAVLSDTLSVGVPAELRLARTYGVPVFLVWAPRDARTPGPAVESLATRKLYDVPAGRTLNLGGLTGDVVALMAEAPLPLERIPAVFRGQIQRDDDLADMPVPSQAKKGDIGLDLYVSDDVTIPAGEWRGIPARVKVAPPDDIWFMIVGRSSALSKLGLQIQHSVIDNGFRGTLFALAYNFTRSDITVKRGDRVAQLLPMPLIRMTLETVSKLPESERGENGFGSTGR